ncbi:SusC/RagA family TonB-linked outer membrane protein [Arachidicoccus ginsenosidivorans]
MKKIHILLLLLTVLPAFIFAQQTDYHGRVIDSLTGDAVAGATIVLLGTTKSNGVITNASGVFTISAQQNQQLSISSIGYGAKTVTLTSNTNLIIKLASQVASQSTVVVIGYGTQKKIDVTGSVAQIKGEEIAKQASVNPIAALQGKVAGVQITNSGAPGSSPDITIRGLGTFQGNPKPLYVVDGVWLDDISFLNTADIKSMSILKDASSESIYGVRGANGVIIITTNKGIAGKLNINYNGYVGYQVANNIPTMADGHEYAILYNELQRVSGGTNMLDSSQFSQGTNWFNAELRNAIVTNHQLSVNGGGDKSVYNLSLGYLSQQGLLKTNKYQRYTLNFANEIHFTPKITFGYNVMGAYSKSHDVPGGIWRYLYTAPPIMPVRFSNGFYGDPGYYGLGSSVSNPQVTLDYNNAATQIYHINGNAYVNIDLLRHFTLHSILGGTYHENDFKNFTPVYKANANQMSSHNTLSINTSWQKDWIIDNTLTYANTFGGVHHVSIMAGQEAQRIYNYSQNSTGLDGGLSSDPATWYLKLASGNGTTTDDISIIKRASYFGRLTYSYKSRYSLTSTLRSDASSVFTDNSGRALLPSVGVAWIITGENFMQDQQVFDLLKLKASWGEVGNDGIPAYTASQQTTSSSIIFGNTQTISSGQSVQSPLPPPLTWEKSAGTDIGLEAALLHNRLEINADYYNKKTQNFIYYYGLQGALGYTTSYVIENIGELQNQGLEFSATWHDQASSDFSYSISANIAYNKNEFTKNNYGGNQKFYSGGGASTGGQLGTITTLGLPVGAFYGYKVIGIFQSPDDVQNYKNTDGVLYQPNAVPGDFKYAKLSDDGLAINGNDRTMIGNPNPKYTYGLNTSFTYRHFDLAIDLSGVADVDVYNANKGLRFGAENFTKDFYDKRWHGQGSSNTDPSVNLGGGQNYYINSWYVEDGSYLKIRNIQLGYTLPLAGNHLGIEKLRLYINAQNPVIFTKYTGFSPEISGGTPGNINIDNNVYPLSAIYNFGVNLTF